MLVGGKRSLLITPLPFLFFIIFCFLSDWIRSDNTRRSQAPLAGDFISFLSFLEISRETSGHLSGGISGGFALKNGGGLLKPCESGMECGAGSNLQNRAQNKKPQTQVMSHGTSVDQPSPKCCSKTD
jgi:hypothetical protein